MKTSRGPSTTWCFLLLLSVSLTAAEVVPFDHCGPTAEESGCTIHEVRVTPCPEVESNRPCVIKKGTQATIEFDYTRVNASEAVLSQAYWKTATGDNPLKGMDQDACKNTPCPVTENERHTYNNTISISRKYPPRNYNVKWAMWDEDAANITCCFVFRIKLVL